MTKQHEPPDTKQAATYVDTEHEAGDGLRRVRRVEIYDEGRVRLRISTYADREGPQGVCICDEANDVLSLSHTLTLAIHDELVHYVRTDQPAPVADKVTQAWVDAAIKTERERCARIVTNNLPTEEHTRHICDLIRRGPPPMPWKP